MSWSFIIMVVVVVLAPGADFTLIVRNTLSGGRLRGVVTTAGVSSAAATQGFLVSVGLAGVIVRVQPVFLAFKWAGIGYLAWLAFGMLRGAAQRKYQAVGVSQRMGLWTAFQQGFLCNALNPKMLVFYVSLLSQFVAADAPWTVWLEHAWMVPVLGTFWCLIVVVAVGALRVWLERRGVSRALNAASGVVLAGFCVRLATES